MSKEWRRKNPLRYKWQTLKDNAKRRKISFSLTYKEFCEFAFTHVDEFELRGRAATSFHIDRINEARGYEKDNLQMLTNIDNVKKYIKWVHRDEHKINHFRFKYYHIVNDENDEDCPF